MGFWKIVVNIIYNMLTCSGSLVCQRYSLFGTCLMEMLLESGERLEDAAENTFSG